MCLCVYKVNSDSHAPSTEQWLEWITECQTQPQTTEVIEQTLALFQKSLKDLLCEPQYRFIQLNSERTRLILSCSCLKSTRTTTAVPVCRAYAIYALKSYYHCRGLFAPGVETNPQEDDEEEEQQAGKAQQTPQPDDTLQEIWTVDFTRAHLSMAAERATQHIMEVRLSHRVVLSGHALNRFQRTGDRSLGVVERFRDGSFEAGTFVSSLCRNVIQSMPDLSSSSYPLPRAELNRSCASRTCI